MSELISGKEALIALANGGEVEFENPFQNLWVDIKSLTIAEIEGGYYICSDDNEKVKTKFRLKPRTITINNIEVPAPFNPKKGEDYFYLSDEHGGGYSVETHNNCTVEIAAWRTEEGIKQVVKALRSIFNAN